MPKPYIVQKGDTLAKIARKLLGSANQATLLAEFNGITDPNKILVGQAIEVPSSRELPVPPPLAVSVGGGAAAAPALIVPRPVGYAGIVAAFGDVKANLDDDGNLTQDWMNANIGRAHLPYPLILSWNHAQKVKSFACHRKLARLFEQAFYDIQQQGLVQEVQYFGGCLNVRQKRTSPKLSSHSWGIAIDLNPETNALGTRGKMNGDVVAIFERLNFKWGGSFTGKKDPMHFQYCDGY